MISLTPDQARIWLAAAVFLLTGGLMLIGYALRAHKPPRAHRAVHPTRNRTRARRPRHRETVLLGGEYQAGAGAPTEPYAQHPTQELPRHQ
jgi:hypothetical protein